MNDKYPNLRPPETSEEARERGRIGGIKSGEAKREKKKMSAIYQAFIESPEGQKLIDAAIKRGLKGKNPTTSLKELREGTEGSKATLGNDPDNPLSFVININATKPSN